MTTKSSHPAVAAKKKLHTRIAAVQKAAEAAKKTAKLAKLDFRNAKQKFKDARRAAKKLRKEVKALKTELAALAVKKKRRVKTPTTKVAAAPKSVAVAVKPPAKPSATKRVRLIVAPATTATPREAPATISTAPTEANFGESPTPPIDLAPPSDPAT